MPHILLDIFGKVMTIKTFDPNGYYSFCSLQLAQIIAEIAILREFFQEFPVKRFLSRDFFCDIFLRDSFWEIPFERVLSRNSFHEIPFEITFLRDFFQEIYFERLFFVRFLSFWEIPFAKFLSRGFFREISLEIFLARDFSRDTYSHARISLPQACFYT